MATAVKTADGRDLVPCRAEHFEQVDGKTHVRHCNQVRGHDGPHRELSPHTFRVVSEWPKK